MSITVHIKYKDIEQSFTGNVEDVWVNINRFFSKTIPTFNATQNIILTIDIDEAVKSSKGLVAATKEGPVVLVSKQKLTDSESLLLMLFAAHLGYHLGILKRTVLSREELQNWLGKSGKITGTRLGELCRDGLVVKTEEGNYELSTFGVKRLIEELLPQIRAKT